MTKKMDYYDVQREAAGTDRKVRYKDGSWFVCQPFSGLYTKNSDPAETFRPTIEQMNEKEWEVEPEKPVFVWLSCENTGESRLHDKKPTGSLNNWCTKDMTNYLKIEQKNLVPQDKPQKFRLVPADQSAGIPWKKFDAKKIPEKVFDFLALFGSGHMVVLEQKCTGDWDDEDIEYYCPVDEIPTPK
jgi:hypothetical protein